MATSLRHSKSTVKNVWLKQTTRSTVSIRRIFDGDESSALFDDDVSISFTESSNNHAAAESSSQWNTTLFAIWPMEMKKTWIFLRNNFVCLSSWKCWYRNDEISWQEQGRGCYFKRDVTNPLSSVLSYSATVHLGRPAHLADGLSSGSQFDWMKLFTIVSSIGNFRFYTCKCVKA